jgi:hypothetical protein
MQGEAIAYYGVRGYWLVHYLEEQHPGFLKRAFSLRQDAATIERETAREMEMELESFWHEIDDVLVSYFRSK